MALSLGGKSPADKKKKPLPSLLMAAPKASAPPPVDDAPPNDPMPPKGPPPPDAAPPKQPAMDAMGKTVKPGTAMFSNQDETCSTCEYFDDAGVGACKKGVPEADFSTSDPTASRCRFYEGNDDATESDEEKTAEGAPEAEAVPA